VVRRRPLKSRRPATRTHVLSDAEIARINGAQENFPDSP
jgi:hypothetical protein